jgi:hypothetical protein
MSEMLDGNDLMKERRGQTLKVLAILSWISMGMATVSILFALFGGPMTPAELEESKVLLVSQWSSEEIEMIGKPLIEELLMRLDVQNEMHYSLLGIQMAYLILGAFGVYLMYNLRKTGFYYYVVYSIIPIVVELGFFGTGLIAKLIVIFSLGISIVFCILYAVQLKRMS